MFSMLSGIMPQICPVIEKKSLKVCCLMWTGYQLSSTTLSFFKEGKLGQHGNSNMNFVLYCTE